MKSEHSKAQTLNQLLTGKIIQSGVIALVIAVCVVMLVFIPFFRNNATQENLTTNSNCIELIDLVIQDAASFSEYLSSVMLENEDILHYLTEPTDASKSEACFALNRFINYNSNVRAMAVSIEGYEMIDSITKMSDEDRLVLDSELTKTVEQQAFAKKISPVYTTNISYNSYTTAAYIRNFYSGNRAITIILFLNLNNVLRQINNTAANQLDMYYLTDSTDQIYYASDNAELTDEFMAYSTDLVSGLSVTGKGDSIFVQKSISSGFGIVSKVSFVSIVQRILPSLFIIFMIVLMMLALALVLTQSKIREAVKPILDISRHMQSAAKGNLDCKVAITRQDEIGALAESFNKMLDDLNTSLEVINEQKEWEQQQKFNLLISQIDPHFIYNTINSINYLARKQRNEDIVTVNKALMAILRDRLRVTSIQVTDSVAHEIEVVRQYIEIERFMYRGDLVVNWQVPDDLLEALIPKNMIQPLVENALFHGLIDEESGELNGILTITLRKDPANGCISLMVSDNGVGMSEARLRDISEERYDPADRGQRIGLSNIRARLYYLYGEDATIDIVSHENEGTAITVHFK